MVGAGSASALLQARGSRQAAAICTASRKEFMDRLDVRSEYTVASPMVSELLERAFDIEPAGGA
ncbi:hypothetical protein D3C76_1019290 [compost metagenome]